MSTDMQCPGNGTCSNHGNCNVTTGDCTCDFGFHGADCSIEGNKILSLVNKCKINMKIICTYRHTMSW